MMGKHNSESAIGSLNDKVASIEAAYYGAANCNNEWDLINAIEHLFSDKARGVYLSTIHRYKGLENNRVFVLHPEKMPLKWEGQLPWQLTQEMNIKYVALTRSKEYLGFIV